jgi:hypothetical protein
LTRPGADEVQLTLLGDYKSNVALYPTFQEYFRTRKPPFLALWGKNDPFFLRRVPKRSNGIFRKRSYAFSIPGTSRWRPTLRKLPRQCAISSAADMAVLLGHIGDATLAPHASVIGAVTCAPKIRHPPS